MAKNDREQTIHGKKSRYRTLSLVNLIREIADKNDLQALHEFHNNRPVFSYNNGPPVVLIEYLSKFRESVLRRGLPSFHTLEAADKAYDLTLEKFINMPTSPKSGPSVDKKNKTKLKRKGSNCRLYYQAFLERYAKSIIKKPPGGELEEEIRAARIMQGLVRRHFYYSLLEAERRLNPFRSRYNWKVNGGTFTLYLPVLMKGAERREWLEKNIETPTPLKEGERERIQAIINRSFVNQWMVPIEDAQNLAYDQPSFRQGQGKDLEPSLAEVVAEEKANNIQKQRRTIKALGKEKLKKMIQRIFYDLELGEYEEGRIANDFGLSRATFSRFAGSHWHKKETAIPDLWLNLAQVLSNNTAFKEVAKQTGTWKQVKATLKKGAKSQGKGPSHD